MAVGDKRRRVGASGKKKAGQDLAAKIQLGEGNLLEQRSQACLIRFDQQIVPGAILDDLEAALLKRFRTGRSDGGREDFLQRLALAQSDHEGIWRPTVAGLLLACREPRRFLPNAFVQAIAYRGTEARPTSNGDLYQLDAADISGPLDHQAIEACRFVFRNMRVEATKTIGRRDYPQYHLGAVFEAVVNAVAHRDYSVYGSKIRLRLFADRLELSSPGGLTNTMDLGSLPYRQSARNEAITSLLAKCPIPESDAWLTTSRKTLMDRRGEGVGLLLRESENLSGKKPQLSLLDDSELMVSIFAARAPLKEPRGASGNVPL